MFKVLAAAGLVLLVLGFVQVPGLPLDVAASGKYYLQVGAQYPQEIVAGTTVDLGSYAYYTSGGQAYWVEGVTFTWSIAGGALSPTTAVTDSEGRAYTRWQVPSEPGGYEWKFSGEHPDFDLSYASKTIILEVVSQPLLQAPTTLTLTVVPSAVEAGGAVVLEATLTSESLGLAGKVVEFYGSWHRSPLASALTQADGSARTEVNAPQQPGGYTVTAFFEGDSDYEAAISRSLPLTVAEASGPTPTPAPTRTPTVLTVQVAAAEAPRLTVITLEEPERLVVSGTLKTAAGAPVSGRTVKLTSSFLGFLAAVQTGADGGYSAAVGPPYAGGTYTYTAVFEGDSQYQPSTASTVVHVAAETVNPPELGVKVRFQPLLAVPGAALLAGSAVSAWLRREED